MGKTYKDNKYQDFKSRRERKEEQRKRRGRVSTKNLSAIIGAASIHHELLGY